MAENQCKLEIDEHQVQPAGPLPAVLEIPLSRMCSPVNASEPAYFHSKISKYTHIFTLSQTAENAENAGAVQPCRVTQITGHLSICSTRGAVQQPPAIV